MRTADTNRLPYIRLLDSFGGGVKAFEALTRTYLTSMDMMNELELLQVVPVVSAVMGSVAGGAAVAAVECHFNVMVKGRSQVLVAGPPVVKAAFGADISKEDLGNDEVQVVQSGVIANLAENEADAFAQIRRFLSYLPQNVWEISPRLESDDPPDRREERLISAIPDEKTRVYDALPILEDVDEQARARSGSRFLCSMSPVVCQNPSRLREALGRDAANRCVGLVRGTVRRNHPVSPRPVEERSVGCWSRGSGGGRESAPARRCVPASR